MEDRKRQLLKVLLTALALAAVGTAGWFLLGGKETDARGEAAQTPAARKERRDERLEEQAARLRRTLEAKHKGAASLSEEPDPAAAAMRPPLPVARPTARAIEPAPLTGAERATLLGMSERLYSPERLKAAIESGRAADMVREMSRMHSEMMSDEGIGSPAALAALGRMGLVLDYGLNILHAQRPQGDEEIQRRMIERINQSFSERIDALNADYPFLGLRLVEP